RRIGELSGGQRQRVYIARALASRPHLRILDEPTGGVDTVTQAKFYSILERLNVDRGITIILSSHDITAVSHLATKVACINRKLYYHGEPKEAFWSEVLPKTYGYPVKFVAHNHAV
ncbi:MAG: metal ABC transporter ATP-binding protein, partial [Candidatus Bathyarchaeia archaeon]